jgi:hypothetical protein
MVRINIALDFSKFPGGRYRRLGKFSGEEFREDRLLPALRAGEKVEVVLDGTAGYGSSFLEEAFGGLVRAGITMEKLRVQLFASGATPVFDSYVAEIWQYIAEENARQPKIS